MVLDQFKFGFEECLVSFNFALDCIPFCRSIRSLSAHLFCVFPFT